MRKEGQKLVSLKECDMCMLRLLRALHVDISLDPLACIHCERGPLQVVFQEQLSRINARTTVSLVFVTSSLLEHCEAKLDDIRQYMYRAWEEDCEKASHLRGKSRLT